MGFLVEQRASDSPLIETVTRGRTVGAGTTIRPSESCWHMVLVRYRGEARLLVVGPLTTAGQVSYTEGAEILWIKFRLGAFMPHLPVGDFVDTQTPLPAAGAQSFWLNGSAWRFPDYDNADTFVSRLARAGILTLDPVVAAVLQQQRPEHSPRTVRHRFQRAAGFSQAQLHQFRRARQAEGLLRQGLSILDTVDQAGYADQPHLTRALKKWIGYTPAQLLRQLAP
jgi:hypothetical protein